MQFDEKNHAEILLEASGLVGYAASLCEGLSPANGQMNHKQFNSTAAGAFGVLALALDKAFWALQEAEHDYRESHGITYGGDKASLPASLTAHSEPREQITKLWRDYYHELTGNEGAPNYDENGSLFWWIAKHTPGNQTEILHKCYNLGYADGRKRRLLID